MNARASAGVDRDGWTPHVLIAIFDVLVTVILRAVPGWSAPLNAWIVLAAPMVGLLAAHAAGRGAVSAWRRRWRGATVELMLAAGLATVAVGLPMFGRRLDVVIGEDAFAVLRAAMPHAWLA